MGEAERKIQIRLSNLSIISSQGMGPIIADESCKMDRLQSIPVV